MAINVSWGTIKSLLVFFGPMLLSKGWAWYKAAKAQNRQRNQPVKPLTRSMIFAIATLIAAAALFAISTIPIFLPENIFEVTMSQPSTGFKLIAKRLAELRTLTEHDELILAKFENKASRLLYYKYGPDVIAACPFCNSQDPTTYMLYAAPAIALTHLLNAVVVGIATSEPIAGQVGLRWRPLATYVAAAVLVVDAYLVASWDPKANESARVQGELFFFHWTVRMGRFLTFAALDLALAGVLYLSATNRLFGVPPTVAEEIDATTAELAQKVMRVRSANVLKNTIARDAELRAVEANYWIGEGTLMQEAMESEDVINSINSAVENGKIDLEKVELAADEYSRRLLGLPASA